MTHKLSRDELPSKFYAKRTEPAVAGGNEVTLCCFPRRAEDDKQSWRDFFCRISPHLYVSIALCERESY